GRAGSWARRSYLTSFCRLGCLRAPAPRGFLRGWSRLGLRLLGGLELAHRWPVQFQPIGVMDDAIEDGVGEGRLTDDLVPLVEGELAGDERRAAAIAVLDDLHQIAPLIGSEPVWAPIVEDQQIGFDQGAEQAGEATGPVG